MASTTPVEEGTTVSSRQYLADASAAADAVSDFSLALAETDGVARPAVLRRLAPRLRDAQERTRAHADRLAAQRLEDRRLERQREGAAGALDRVADAMARVVAAAEREDGAAAASAAAGFATAVGALRSLPDES
ncbi:hypothetical protein [Miltoncostaea marina]|uniref:hypothetical protein n=1 Tax=Miltoncostaea marina TaxID=2843215 RepID=UPI001C3CAC87|nr:hypothetical protein [Miltoncostaea marina]